ncbi:MAG: heat-shock protein Hsp20 [Proteobacteria bacterium]|nr:MAG: heat-shock protein Hsp20 [Pseudomonadota bacterium]
MGDKQKAKERKGEVAARSPLAELGLRSWHPFARLFEDLWDDKRLAAVRWSPAVDVTENERAYAITIELPGARREDVSLELHGDVLDVRGEKRCEREEKDERRHMVERTYGAFQRSFTLPANADASNISATFKDGVLTIEIPKSEAAKPRQVDIKTA